MPNSGVSANAQGANTHRNAPAAHTYTVYSSTAGLSSDSMA
ncbi:hypothetical protein ALQ30_200724 [Pseudomonas syringae pv. persicae]|uniref:Uncharacterized protein n=1 Tax=Pseudomonas syringae pv. persicae TaxID=237306 RepID=A0A3M4B5H0_9PSED|nr:hypothetical protein ALQ30_200724 [Pseudomonas syringae pv. persicae]